MKYISAAFILLFLCACSAPIRDFKGDEFVLRLNTDENYEEYRQEVLRLEKKADIEKMPSFNQNGLHIYLYSSSALNFRYFFISETLLVESFFIHNIDGIDVCGKMVVDNNTQSKIFDYGVENFPYISIRRDGRFPLKGEEKTFDHIVGYRQFELGNRKYFSYYLFSEERVHELQRVGFPQYPQIINEYNDFVKTIVSLTDSSQSSETCRSMKQKN